MAIFCFSNWKLVNSGTLEQLECMEGMLHV